jgi:hypothetical protein
MASFVFFLIMKIKKMTKRRYSLIFVNKRAVCAHNFEKTIASSEKRRTFAPSKQLSLTRKTGERQSPRGFRITVFRITKKETRK